jgi:hypothetical protein
MAGRAGLGSLFCKVRLGRRQLWWLGRAEQRQQRETEKPVAQVFSVTGWAGGAWASPGDALSTWRGSQRLELADGLSGGWGRLASGRLGEVT